MKQAATLRRATALKTKLKEQAAVLKQAQLDAVQHAKEAADLEAEALEAHLAGCEAPQVENPTQAIVSPEPEPIPAPIPVKRGLLRRFLDPFC
jgi:hypothetical protein